MTYDADPAGWWTATEGKVGTPFPVFLARGNHDDSSWSGFLTKAANHLGGATRTSGPHNAAYKTVYRGLTLIAIKKGDTATTINNLVGSDNHIWRVCNWHQNQNKMQVGGKGDEMGWAVYEACRQQGAIILSGHEHSYHRTKTMSNCTNQTVDPSCTSGSSLCVGPSRTFVTVVGRRRHRAALAGPLHADLVDGALPIAEHQRSQLSDLGVDLHHQPGRAVRGAVHHLQRGREPQEGHRLLQDHQATCHRLLQHHPRLIHEGARLPEDRRPLAVPGEGLLPLLHHLVVAGFHLGLGQVAVVVGVHLLEHLRRAGLVRAAVISPSPLVSNHLDLLGGGHLGLARLLPVIFS